MSSEPTNHHTLQEGVTAAQAIEDAVDAKQWMSAQHLCEARLAQDPRDVMAHRYIGLAMAEQGQLHDGVKCYEHALSIQADDAVTLIKFSVVLTMLRDFDRAYETSKRATEVAPLFPRSWISLSATCYMQSKHELAVAAAKQGLSLELTADEKTVLLTNLSSNLRDLGQLDEALEYCRQAITLMPDWEPPYTNQMLFLQSMPQATAMDLRRAAIEYSDRFEQPYRSEWPTFQDTDRSPNRRLRVGFLSPDFNNHSIMYFAESLLPRLDRHQFEVVALYLQWGEDQATLRTKRHVDEFHCLAGMDAAAVAQQILGLKIDVLIDLAGHTAHNGLSAMARKPAPVQVTWLGFPGTTGLQAMDWRLTDAIADQPGADAEYIEKLYRLPDAFCVYRPHSRNPLYRYQPAYQVRETPAKANGHITFGSCNGLSKLTDDVLTTWANVLQAVPGSRLLVEGKGFDTAQAREDFATRCSALGLSSHRLDLIDRDMSRQYLTYHSIDIALDSFPLTGGTTSADALWMGVPMVTMNGSGFRSRMGVTLLHGIDRAEWVAPERADYVRIAAELAQDIERLNHIRLEQRDRMEASPLMNEKLFASHFGNALRDMWEAWCAGGQASAPTGGKSAPEAHTAWPPTAIQISVGTGTIITLEQAQTQLQTLTEAALEIAPRQVVLAGHMEPPPITEPAWLEVLTWCSYILDSLPNEPLALATLAEIEHAHGRTDLASMYLNFAQKSLSPTTVL